MTKETPAEADKKRSDREHAVWQMRQAGRTFREIGEAFGFSPARATQLNSEFERRLKREAQERQTRKRRAEQEDEARAAIAAILKK